MMILRGEQNVRADTAGADLVGQGLAIDTVPVVRIRK